MARKRFTQVAEVQRDGDWDSVTYSLELDLGEGRQCQAWIKAFVKFMSTMREHGWALTSNGDYTEYNIINDDLDLPVRLFKTSHVIGHEPEKSRIFSLCFKDLMLLETELKAYLRENPWRSTT